MTAVAPGPAPGRRGSWRRGLLVVAAAALPVVEIWLLVQLAGWIGAGWTLLVVLLGIVLGVVLARREGRRAWASLTTALRTGGQVSDEIAHGGLVLLGGMALILPGLLTDVVGALLLLPPTRRLAVRGLHRWAQARVRRMGVDVDVLRARMDRANTVEGEVADAAPPPRPDRDDPTVIRGEIEQ
ncbi:FxsA family protein [Auraticoccus sp. F435]|uniref:FxsA family protein n=1 Tax=Auraticoccus cholistanensis TaxID=2656650 RepID=A0A6A9UW47_9ACTN|nr:FxsA family protein [Auraticoccus cholistanensis]MVA75842.1 FxsA family protein [Auraticoccus cholistanensis]